MRIENYYLATTLEDAFKILKEDSKNVILGGGLWLKKMNAPIKRAIDLSALGLDKIVDKGEYVEIGAMVTQRQFEKNELVGSIANGLLVNAVEQIVGPAFRNSATIGGSIAGAYPFSDLLTPLLTLDTKLVFYPEEEMSLEQFLTNKGKKNGILTHIIIKKCSKASYFKKVKVNATDFPMINIAVTKCECGKTHIVIGSRPGVAQIAHKASDYISSFDKPSEKEYVLASEMAIEELAFSSTIAISESYRKVLAKTYVKRGLMEVNK